MKKYSLIAILLSMLVLPFMVSCTKPDDDEPTNPENPINPDNPLGPIIPDTPEDVMGVYNPGKKIKKVYVSDEYSYPVKELEEVWHWNGNLLTSIDYYDNGQVYYNENYIYDGNRLSRIEMANHSYYSSQYSDFEYEGNLLKSINRKGSGNWGTFIETFMFEYQDDKISKINQNFSSSDPNANEVVLYELSWTGDNVRSIITRTGNGASYAALRYDTKENPLCGFYTIKYDECILSCLSKNNIVSVDATGGEDDVLIGYVYEYDNEGFPIAIVIHYYYDKEEQHTEYRFYEYE